MTGYNTVLMIEHIKERADRLGFILCYPRHGYGDDKVAIKPKDEDALPIYARDAECFSGTLEQLKVFLGGIEWARDYDLMLKVSDQKKRERKEQDCRNRKLLQLLKNTQTKEAE